MPVFTPESKKKTRGDVVRHVTFESVEDYVRYVREFDPKTMGKHPSTYTASRTNEKQRSWDLNAGWEGALKLAHEGWAIGREMIEELSTKLTDDVLRQHQIHNSINFEPNVAGFLPLIPEYLAGIPEQMMDLEPKPQINPIIRLNFSMTNTWNITADAIMRKGAAVASLVDLLEVTGRRCEVVVSINLRSWGGGNTDEYQHYDVIVKRADMPLLIDSLAFMMAHPASFRRIGFAAMERTHGELDWALHGGYNQVYREVYHPEEYSLVLADNSQKFESDTYTFNWLMEQLKEQGLILEEDD